jgi:hypothetical protein
MADPLATSPPEATEPAPSWASPVARGEVATAARDDEEFLPPIADASSARWPVIVLALVLSAVGFGYALIRGSSPDPAEAIEEVGARPPAPSVGVPSPLPEPIVSASPPGPCGDGSVTDAIAPPANVVPAPVADYRFRHTYGSDVGNAPDLVGAERNTPAFVYDVSIDRTVLSFSGRGGLSLPASQIVGPDGYTIELVFRFDEVDRFRKIIDFKDGSADSGLYVQDRCLTFFPKDPGTSTAIELNTYAQVVLTRDASQRVVGYVDGVHQFGFGDAAGIAEIASETTLRFFVDDSETGREYSGGAVTQIRLYDRALAEDEVAALACSVRRVLIANLACPG